MQTALLGNFKAATREPCEYVVYAMSDNIKTWHILIRNISGEGDLFEGGEYLFRMTTTSNFPASPPNFIALTPNGVYKVNNTVCISIGVYHANNFKAVGGLGQFAVELANGIIGYETLSKSGGIGILHTSVATKRDLAKASKTFNEKHHPDILESLRAAYASYAPKWDLSKSPPELIKMLSWDGCELSIDRKELAAYIQAAYNNAIARAGAVLPDNPSALLRRRLVHTEDGRTRLAVVEEHLQFAKRTFHDFIQKADTIVGSVDAEYAKCVQAIVADECSSIHSKADLATIVELAKTLED